MEQGKYLVVLSLPQDLQADLDVLRKKYNPDGYKRSLSHFTLVPPFTSHSSTRQIIAQLKVICDSVKPFYFYLEGVNITFPKDIIALKTSNSKNLGRLAKRLALPLRPLMEKDGQSRLGRLLKRTFRPHITVAAKHLTETDKELEKVLTKRFNNYPPHCEGVELWRLEGEHWKSIKKVCFTA